MIVQSETPIKPEVRVAGLDLAARKSGVCLMRDGWTHTELILEPKLRGADRLDSIVTKLSNIVIDPFRPDLVVIEGYAYGATNKLAILAEVGGVVKLALRRAGIPFVVVPPKILKLFVSGNGAASKKLVIASVEKYYGIVTDSDDIADSVACAAFARVLLTGNSTRRYELEVIRKFQEERQKPQSYRKTTPNI